VFRSGPPAPVPEASWEAGAELGAVRFSAERSGGVAWSWDFGDGETFEQPDPLHRYDAPGTYEASVTITYADGETRRRDLAVEVHPPQLALSLTRLPRRRLTEVAARVRNTGAAASGEVKVCAEAVRRRARVRPRRCRVLSPLSAGSSRV